MACTQEILSLNLIFLKKSPELVKDNIRHLFWTKQAQKSKSNLFHFITGWIPTPSRTGWAFRGDHSSCVYRSFYALCRLLSASGRCSPKLTQRGQFLTGRGNCCWLLTSSAGIRRCIMRPHIMGWLFLHAAVRPSLRETSRCFSFDLWLQTSHPKSEFCRGSRLPWYNRCFHCVIGG